VTEAADRLRHLAFLQEMNDLAGSLGHHRHVDGGTVWHLVRRARTAVGTCVVPVA
jgi:hypothetical protein